MKVLFIDDELEVEALAKVLKNRHPEDNMELVDSLASARKKIWSEKFDVMVVDLMMPADDESVPGSSDEAGLIGGLLLLELVGCDENCINNKTPFIILTGLIQNVHKKVDEAQRKYAGRFIEKPVHPDTLYEAISSATKRQ
jgi:DNA-binding NtrC family response regulator